MKWCIARPKQGIALNGFEYACYPGSDKVAVFDNPEQAKIAMLYYGMIEKGERQKKMDITLISAIASVFDMPIEQIAEYEKELIKS